MLQQVVFIFTVRFWTIYHVILNPFLSVKLKARQYILCSIPNEFYLQNCCSKFLILVVQFLLFMISESMGFEKKSFVYHCIFIESSKIFAALYLKSPIFCDVTLRRCKHPLHLEDPVDCWSSTIPWKWRRLSSFVTSRSIFPATQRHIPEEWNPKFFVVCGVFRFFLFFNSNSIVSRVGKVLRSFIINFETFIMKWYTYCVGSRSRASQERKMRQRTRKLPAA
jgi:hypothetical protein